MGPLSLSEWARRTHQMLEDPTTWPQEVLPVKRQAKGKRPMPDVDLAVVVCAENTPGNYRYDVYATNLFAMKLEEKNRVMKGASPSQIVEEGWLVD